MHTNDKRTKTDDTILFQYKKNCHVSIFHDDETGKISDVLEYYSACALKQTVAHTTRPKKEKILIVYAML